MTVIRLAAAGLLALTFAMPATAQTAPAVDAPAVAPVPPAPPSATMSPLPSLGLEEVQLPDGRKVLRPAASPSGSSHRCGSQAIS